MPLETILVPCLTDNYAVLVHDADTGKTLCVDAPDARPIQTALAEKNWKLDTILITHRHYDHVEGLELLKNVYKAKVIGPAAEAQHIPSLDEKVSEGASLEFAGHPIEVIETPGHTMGHVCYHWPEDKLLFSGDTLFILGCGRLFEGSPADMWDSLSKLKSLPKDTKVYCGHEYTLSNAEFAIKIEPGNIDLQTRLVEIKEARSAMQPTLPSTIGAELKTNPFLRPDSTAIRTTLNMENAADEDVFAAIRKRKDQG